MNRLSSCPVFAHSEIGMLARAHHVPPKAQKLLDQLNEQYQAFLDGEVNTQLAAAIAAAKVSIRCRTEIQRLTRYYRTGRI